MGQTLGVELSTGVAYEPGTGCWREVWPTPIVSMAAFITLEQPKVDALPSLSEAGPRTIIFREDSFDATTRIRRGRFYQSNRNINNTRVRFRDATEATAYVHHFFTYGHRQDVGLVAIGIEDCVWRILGAERISTGEWLVTLKARGGVGLLPEINAGAIPEAGRSDVIKAVDHMVDVAHRETPGSVVDVARNTACLLMAVYAAALEEEVEKQREIRRRDLAKVRAYFEGHTKLKGMVVAISASRILERLHPRNKPGEQKKHNLRLITEEDATFAVGVIGLLLNELGWAQETARVASSVNDTASSP